VAALLVLAPVAQAQERTPSPKELWNAYPLDAPHSPTATATVTATSRRPAAQAGSGPPMMLVAIAPVALLALAGGVVLRRRGRGAPAEPAITPDPMPASRRFDWRTYPPPARPAPPAPPVPGRTTRK